MRIWKDQADEVIIIMALLLQCLPDKGVLYHTNLVEIVCMEAERHALQDKGISGTVIRICLAASCNTTSAVLWQMGEFCQLVSWSW